MKITNKYGVPAPLLTLASKEYYSKGASQYSVTELLSSPQIRRLQERFHDQMEQDVSDMLWAMLGSALHVVMERGETPGYVSEERLFAEVGGTTISGQIDLQEVTAFGVTIIDYKFTSSWAVMQEEKKEWVEQLNLYKWLVETVKGQKVVGLKICAFIRDFSRHDTRENYPKAPITMVDIPVWDAEKTNAFVNSRLDAHQQSKVDRDFGDDLQPCTDEDRWMKETTYAVKKEGRKTAVRVFKTMEEAVELAKEKDHYVETRPGEPVRCTGNYCGVADYCNQYKLWKAGFNVAA
jgi:hypothetical protein